MPKLVLVKWIDSVQSMAWNFDDYEAPKPKVCESVGWLLAQNDEAVVVTGNMTDKCEQHCGDMVIPTVAIKSITDLSVADAPAGCPQPVSEQSLPRS